jgi:hypothetical protein
MKKRILFALLAVAMVVSFAACGAGSSANKVEIESPVALIDGVWTTFAEEEKFPVMGGDFNTPVDGAAGKFDISDKENAVATLHIAEDALPLVDDVATLTHAMNANTFSAAAYHVADAKNTETLVSSLKESIKGTQWMCGFPDTLIIYTVNDDYVVAAFGNKDAIASFKTKLATVYGESAALKVEEALV